MIEYIIIGISIFFFTLGIDVVVRDKIYSMGILCFIYGIILLLIGLYILGIIEVKIT